MIIRPRGAELVSGMTVSLKEDLSLNRYPVPEMSLRTEAVHAAVQDRMVHSQYYLATYQFAFNIELVYYKKKIVSMVQKSRSGTAEAAPHSLT